MAKSHVWMRLNFDKKWRTMIAIERKLKNQTREAVEATAEGIVNDIRSSWSSVSPSSVGSPPAIVTGNLDSSVVVDPQGRDVLGRFAGKDAEVLFIRVDTSEGANPGDRGNYAMALEDPDYLDRPFLAPALERAGGQFSSNIKRFVRL